RPGARRTPAASARSWSARSAPSWTSCTGTGRSATRSAARSPSRSTSRRARGAACRPFDGTDCRGRPSGTLRTVTQCGSVNTAQLEKVKSGRGFFAALDQSGGSTPKALAEYGIARERYGSDEGMFDLVHAMRTRVMTSPAFDGTRILAAILFEQTMDRTIEGVPTAQYLWETKNVVPILKVDLGLAAEQDGVQLMKPIDTLDDLLARANAHGI